MPKALSPKPSAQRPKPSAQSPEPEAESLKPSARSPEPEAESLKPSAQRLKPSALSPKPSAGGPKPSALSPKPSALSRKLPAGAQPAYVAALRLLARRELSERQVRQRLLRKGYTDEDVQGAVERLKAERAIDDARVAEAIARTETAIKRRGKLRVRLAIEKAGIAGPTARAALDAVFGELDDEALLDAALNRRLRSRLIADDREFQRLYRYLAAQGFESDRILKALNARRQRSPLRSDDD